MYIFAYKDGTAVFCQPCSAGGIRDGHRLCLTQSEYENDFLVYFATTRHPRAVAIFGIVVRTIKPKTTGPSANPGPFETSKSTAIFNPLATTPIDVRYRRH